MRKYLYKNPLDPLPYQVTEKHDPFVIGAIVAAVAALAAGGASYASAKKTNKTNQQIAEDTNATNLQLAREQNDWNEQMYLKYDTPSAQKQQLIDAGYNPLFTQAGSTANLQSSDLANQVAYQLDNSGYAQAFQGTGDAISNAVNSYFANRVSGAQVEQLESQSDLNSTQAWAQRYLTPSMSDMYESQSQNYQASTKRINELLPFETSNYESMTQLNKANALLMEAQKDKTFSEKDFIDKQNEWYDDLSEAQIAKLRSGVRLDYQECNEIATMLPYKVLEKEGIIGQISADIQNILLDNSLKSYDAKVKATQSEFAKKYGWTPDDNHVQSLLKLLAGAEVRALNIAGSKINRLLERWKGGSHSNPNFGGAF